MNTVNMFDLTKNDNEKSVIETPQPITSVLSQEESLIGYTEVQQSDWEKIPIGSHIRYLRNDGAFRKGGVIKNFYINSSGYHQGKKVIQMSSSTSYKAQQWSVTINDIKKIWKKNITENMNMNMNMNNSINQQTNGDLSLLIKDNEKHNENIDHLLKMVDGLKISIAELQNDKKRMMNLIKKIHDRIK